MNRRLIVTGDDLGLSQAVNTGIIRARAHGILRSASLLVGQVATRDGIERARAADVEIGLHLNVTTGRCQADPAAIPLLAGKNGRFIFEAMPIPDGVAWLREAVERSNGFLDQVWIEFEAQAAAMAELRVFPAFVNTHHYVASIHPDLAQLSLDFANELGVPARGDCRPIADEMGLAPEQRDLLRAVWRQDRVPVPTRSVTNLIEMSDHDTPFEKYFGMMARALENLVQGDDPCAIELVTHPSVSDHSVQDDYGWARRLESEFVHSNAFREMVTGLGFEISLFSSLPRMEKER